MKDNSSKKKFYSKLRKHLKSPGLRSIFQKKRKKNGVNKISADIECIHVPVKSSPMKPHDCKVFRKAGEKVMEPADVFFQPTVSKEYLVKQKLRQSNILTASIVSTTMCQHQTSLDHKKDGDRYSASSAAEGCFRKTLTPSQSEHHEQRPISDSGSAWKFDKMENVRSWLNSQQPSEHAESVDDDSHMYLDHSSSSSRSSSPLPDEGEESKMSVVESSPSCPHDQSMSCRSRKTSHSKTSSGVKKRKARIALITSSLQPLSSGECVSEPLRPTESFTNDREFQLPFPDSGMLSSDLDSSLERSLRLQRKDEDFPFLHSVGNATNHPTTSYVDPPVLPTYKNLTFTDSSESDRELETRFSKWLDRPATEIDCGHDPTLPSCSRWVDSHSPVPQRFAPDLSSSNGSSDLAYRTPFFLHHNK